MIKVTATDNQGATSTMSVSVAVGIDIECFPISLNATDVPIGIPDNTTTGITSSIPVAGIGTVASLSLSLNLTHTFRGDLVVTLISPGGTSFLL